jgi:cellulose synthase/poly-beta-1,6-N-acetylglucosamine synthase-like glycosyltransferase
MMLFFWILLVPALGYALLFVSAGRIWSRWTPLPPKVHEQAPLSIAVVAAFRNEEARLPALLRWWHGLDTQGYEVRFVLADDHSNDRSVQIVRQFQQEHPEMPLHLVEPDSGEHGKKAALTAAIRAGAADVCLLTDADSCGGSAWLQLMAATLVQKQLKMVCGPVALEQGTSFLRRFQALEHAGLVVFGAVTLRLGRPTMCNGASLMFYRDVWEALGAYEAHRHLPGGDDELLMRAVAAKHPGSVGFCRHPEALVHTAPAADMMAFLMQRLRWASKGRMQGMAVRIFRSALVLWYAALLCVLPLLFFEGLPVCALIVGTWLLKLGAEYVYFKRITPFFGMDFRTSELLSFQLFQTAYPVLIALARILRLRFHWKGRAYG